MFDSDLKYGDKNFWSDLSSALEALVVGEPSKIANQANFSSQIYHAMPDLNWCGFYLWDQVSQELVLGPFQGKPACIRIRSGRGVCGTAFVNKQSMLVPDVDAFPGHIACDSASKSELVIPLLKQVDSQKVCLGVLDLDSPKKDRFTEVDAQELEKICAKYLDWLV